MANERHSERQSWAIWHWIKEPVGGNIYNNNKKWIKNYLKFSQNSSHFLWNCSSGSDSTSLISIFDPNFLTSGCFLHISQPMCEKKNPRLEFDGSAFVSLYLWWTRWSRTHSMMSFSMQIVCMIMSSTWSFMLALKLRCAQRRWAPTGTPKPAIIPYQKSE